MTRRRPSIARLMAAIALVAATLAVFRSEYREDKVWGDSFGEMMWPLGELAPILAIGMSGLGLVNVTSGRPRRFAVGLATTGLAVGLAFWLAPLPVRKFALQQVIVPVVARFGRTMGKPTLAWFLKQPLETEENRRPFRTVRAPFVSREAQVGLGLLELAIASIGGLLAAIPRPLKPDCP